MLAITILYEGRVPEQNELDRWLSDNGFIEKVHAETVEDDKAIANRIVMSIVDDEKKPDSNLGDSAVIMLAYLTDMSNDYQFIAGVLKILDSKNKGLINACKYLAKGGHVSEKVAEKYNFNEHKRDLIKKLLTNV